jgi:type VI protein secretion system component VasF
MTRIAEEVGVSLCAISLWFRGRVEMSDRNERLIENLVAQHVARIQSEEEAKLQPIVEAKTTPQITSLCA